MNIKKTVKSLLAGAVAFGGLIASAAPTVEVTQVEKTQTKGVVNCSYTVSGLEGKSYDLVLKVGAEDKTAGAVSTNLVFESVAEGAAIQTIDCKAVLGKAYPNVTFYATLEKSEEAVQLWDGGPYWAKCNVGATKPEEAGWYFWWGDTEGYVRNAADDGWVSAKDGTKTITFNNTVPANSTYGKNAATLQSEGWIDSTGNLTMEHDAARVNLGGEWRMPTDAEIQALIENTTTTWTTQNGVNGRLVTSKTNGRSIFIPAVGVGYDSGLYNAGSYGCYWSSTPGSDYSDYAWLLYFGSGYFDRYNLYDLRDNGQSVRPVRGFAE